MREEEPIYLWPSHWQRPVAHGSQGAISSNSIYATRAGLAILRRGGNAIDAAVAVSLVLSVVEPHHSGIGGGCFSLIYRAADRSFYAVDGRGVAPKNAHPGLFVKNGKVQDAWKNVGGQSVAVPGLLKTLELLLERFGTLSFAEVSEAAIALAENGFGVSYTGALTMCDRSVGSKLALSSAMRALYLKKDGSFFCFGEKQRNPEIAGLLKRVAKEGTAYFYGGDVGESIVREINARGGCFVSSDLTDYEPRFREPLRGYYRNFEVVTSAPPSGGCTVLEMLNILENSDLRGLGHNTAEYLHRVAEAIKFGFADRSAAAGDPDFVKVDTEKLISKVFARERFLKITDRASDDFTLENTAAQDYPGNTSHFSIMDRFGNVVSQTQTIRDWFGCGIVVKGRGFVLNNAMSDFSAADGVRTSQGLSYGSANSIEGGKTPLSSMSPCILMKDGKPFLAIGAAGGPRIITGTLQGILNAIDFDMLPERLVNLPYIHVITNAQGVEAEYGISRDTLRILEEKGHRIIRNSVDQAMSTMLNSVMRMGGEFYAAGTGRVDGCGGALLKNGDLILEGVSQEEAD